MDPFSDYVEDLVNELTDTYHLSRCEAGGIVAHVLTDKRIFPLQPPEKLRIIENHVLAKCLNDNEYLFRSRP